MCNFLSMFLIISLAACANITGPEEPASYVEVSISDDWRKWYGEMQQCSGLQGDQIDSFKFRAVKGFRNMKDGAIARTYHAKKIVYIDNFYLTSEPLMKHEFMHMLIGKSTNPKHESKWLTKCPAMGEWHD